MMQHKYCISYNNLNFYKLLVTFELFKIDKPLSFVKNINKSQNY